MYLQIPGTNVRLLGSLHMFPEGAPELPAWVTDAYEWAEELAFESDMPTILPFFRSSSESNLREMLEPEVWATLKSIWPIEGPVSPLSSIHPWAALLLAPSFCQRLIAGVEPRFTQWANQHTKQFTFLETAQEIAATFGTVPSEEILAGLRSFVLDLSAPQKTLRNIHAAWLSKDLAGVYAAASQAPTFSYPGLRSAVLESRNRAWAPVVEQMLETGKRTLVVVGALHLYGPNNLLELLGRDIDAVQTAG